MDVLVVGLDGLSYNMLERFDIELEYLPGVFEAGPSGDLMSVDTPTTLPAWTSFATGKDPGSHGLTNMIRQAPDYETSPLETNVTDAAAYDFLDDAMFVNLPASVGRMPAADGTHLVSAMLASDKYDAVPEPLRSLDAFDDYLLDHDKALKTDADRYFDHVCEITRSRRAFAREAFETYEPRFGFVLFSTPDWAGHLLSNFSDDGARAPYYQQLLSVVDECTADLASLAENVVLMSDHGFEYKHTNVHLNDWLRDEGYLVERDGGRPSASELAFDAARRVAGRSDRLYEAMRRLYNRIIATDVGQQLQAGATPDVDYPNSRAWQLRYGCVYLNDDRFDHPTVDDPDALRERLVEEMAAITDADGDPVFRAVLSAEEAYANPGRWAPDIVARPAPGRYPTMLASPTGAYASPTNNFNHRYRGVFAATGPKFADGGTVEGMSIVDVLPTVMHALGEAVSPAFDGEVRRDVLAEDREVRVLDPESVPSPRTRGVDESEQDARDEAVEARLEDLGYLE